MNKKMQTSAPAANVVYGMGFIGAAIYFIINATSFWMGVIGILKAIVWPAIIVFQALKYFNM
jgi:hypothetical protein